MESQHKRAIRYIIKKAEEESPELRAELYEMAAEITVDEELCETLLSAAVAIREAIEAQYKLGLRFSESLNPSSKA